MRKCTGCGWIEGNPFGLNANGEEYLGCCPDGNYKEVTAMQELIDYVNSMWANEGWEETVINKATSLIEKEKEQIVKAYDNGYKSCDLDDALEINKTMFSGEKHYKQKYYQNK